MKKTSIIYVAGHTGLIGSSIKRKLKELSYTQIITKTHKGLDLTSKKKVDRFFFKEKPEFVFLAAAKTGGIQANNAYPADFIYQNLMIQANVIDAAYKYGTKKLLFLSSSCIYPKNCQQPMKEEHLMTGALEPTNEPYAIAKIAGIKLCESYNRQHNTDYRSVMPTNLYGPGDNYHPENSHVIPALIRRFHEAKENHQPSVVIWGSGTPYREFLYVDDMAAASIYIMNLDREAYQQQTKPMLSHINVGTGQDLTIKQLAETVAKVTNYSGKIEFDTTKPDGPTRKLMDSTRLNNLGWRPTIELEQGLTLAYKHYLQTLKTDD